MDQQGSWHVDQQPLQHSGTVVADLLPPSTEPDRAAFVSNSPFLEHGKEGNGGAISEQHVHKRRTVFSKDQQAVLEKQYIKDRYLPAPRRSELAAQLGMKESTIKTWFQNRRMKEKYLWMWPSTDPTIAASIVQAAACSVGKLMGENYPYHHTFYGPWYPYHLPHPGYPVVMSAPTMPQYDQRFPRHGHLISTPSDKFSQERDRANSTVYDASNICRCGIVDCISAVSGAVPNAPTLLQYQYPGTGHLMSTTSDKFSQERDRAISTVYDASNICRCGIVNCITAVSGAVPNAPTLLQYQYPGTCQASTSVSHRLPVPAVHPDAQASSKPHSQAKKLFQPYKSDFSERA